MNVGNQSDNYVLRIHSVEIIDMIALNIYLFSEFPNCKI